MNFKGFVGMLTVSILSNICYMVVFPFLPLEFGRYGIKPSTFGFIFAMFSAASMIGSLLVGKIMIVFGRKIILLLGIFIMGLCMALFSTISYLDDPSLVVFFCLVSRFVQGFTSSMIQTTCYSIISVIYKEKKQQYMGYYEGSQGFGWAIGPAIGAILYSLFGFHWTFYILGGSMILTCPLMYIQIPNAINENDNLEQSILDEEVEEVGKSSPVIKATYSELFKRKVFTLSAVCACLSYYSYSYFEPVLPTRLQEFDISTSEILLFFCIDPSGYLALSWTLSFFTDKYDSKIIIVVTIFICGLAQFLIGPSTFLPDSLILMGIGQLMNGVSNFFFCVLSLPVMIHDAEERYPEQKIYAADLSSGVFNFALALGQTVSPIYGSYMTEIIGFRNVATSIGIFFIAYSLIYYLSCVVFTTKSNEEIELQESKLDTSQENIKT
ncbi:unnamed protein product [Moneuplotes crassus]|uniref:Major facilitator superfamily (MFS) profile domain-containing protein n=1 Tax=Euplotes crassus TaxID=5936 RepID=A0AAD1UK33_EUPCR|nr:unnamed protein product [Moneuplotes crassus]